jgi:hypothetical protein
MEILTLLFGCVVHIILILLFEGIFLFVILYPILVNVAVNKTSDYSNTIFRNIIEKGYGQFIVSNKNNKPIFNEPLYSLLLGCAVDEKIYNQQQDLMPYFVYSILLFVLLVSGVIMIMITRYFNIKINYRFVIINSIISFALICGYAFLVLWFILATQPYILNIESDIYKAILDVYNSS